MNQDSYIKPAGGYPRGEKATWEEQADAIVRGQVPGIEKEIPSLLCWLEDGNWPGAHKIADFLYRLGRPVVPHVRDILRQTDDLAWKYWLLAALVRRWPPTEMNEVREEVMALVEEDDDNEVHLVALEIGIMAHWWVRPEAFRLIEAKEQKFPHLKIDLNELRRAVDAW